MAAKSIEFNVGAKGVHFTVTPLGRGIVLDTLIHAFDGDKEWQFGGVIINYPNAPFKHLDNFDIR